MAYDCRYGYHRPDIQRPSEIGANSKLEKGAVTITISRPLLSKVIVDPQGEIGTVTFYVDETDPRLKGRTTEPGF